MDANTCPDRDASSRYAYFYLDVHGNTVIVHGVTHADGRQYTSRTIIDADHDPRRAQSARQRPAAERFSGRSGAGCE